MLTTPQRVNKRERERGREREELQFDKDLREGRPRDKCKFMKQAHFKSTGA